MFLAISLALANLASISSSYSPKAKRNETPTQMAGPEMSPTVTLTLGLCAHTVTIKTRVLPKKYGKQGD